MGFSEKELLGQLVCHCFRKTERHIVPLLLQPYPMRSVGEAFLGAVAALAFRRCVVCMTLISFLDGAAFSFKSCCWH